MTALCASDIRIYRRYVDMPVMSDNLALSDVGG